MTNPKKTKLDWKSDEECQARASKLADDLIKRLKQSAPIDPIAIAKTEHEFLRAGGDDLGDRYDGKLQYDQGSRKFLLYYNTKYNDGMPVGEHHPRTRFSISHELGHYFIEAHHDYLLNGGSPHQSKGEFKSSMQMEREADAFASSLLLPTQLTRPLLNRGELTLSKIERVANDFRASLLCTTIRGVRLSDFPCAVAGLRDGRIAWLFPSKSLKEASCYPGKRTIESPVAQVRWEAFSSGDETRHKEDGLLRHWFQTYDREDDLYEVQVTQEFLPISVMDTLVVLLTMDEEDVIEVEDDDELEEEEDRDRFGRSRA